MSVIEMIDRPVTTQRYKIYNVDVLPRVLLCINVKNKFDENRLDIKRKYNPQYISHFRTVNKNIEPFYYYGIELQLKPQYESLIKELPINRHFPTYSKLLHEYDLSCNTCYGYLSDGVFPIDLCHLQDLSKRDLDVEISTGFSCMLNKSAEPNYVKLINFNILILSRSTGYDN